MTSKGINEASSGSNVVTFALNVVTFEVTVVSLDSNVVSFDSNVTSSETNVALSDTNAVSFTMEVITKRVNRLETVRSRPGAGCHDSSGSRRPIDGEMFLLTPPFIERTGAIR